MTAKWQEPDRIKSQGRKNWAEVADDLKANPMTWALIDEDVSTGMAGNLRKGRVSAFRPENNWEFTTRENAGGRVGKLFARYIGEEKKMAPKRIDENTKYIDMRIGDTMPNGDTIIKAELEPARHDATRSTVKLTIMSKLGLRYSGAAEWSHETYGESIARSKFMAEQPN